MADDLDLSRVRALHAGDPLRIVAIGGGTGLSTLLQGLKPYGKPNMGLPSVVDITAVVTVTDDGGSSGRLRRDFSVLPPGDIRNCMVALSEDEALLARLFQYRFAAGQGLKGHSFGNLFLTALANITGDFAQAVKLSCEVLAIVGRIYPSTAAENVSLEAVRADGTTVRGETRISRSRSKIRCVALVPGNCEPLEETLDAIAKADLITLGPGSLYTSVIPNLLVKGIPEAIRQSAAVKAYFVNLMWQPGETMHLTAADHVEAIYRHARAPLFDCAIVNRTPIGAPLRKKYARREAEPVPMDLDRLRQLGLDIREGDLLQESQKIRHNPKAIARIAIALALEGRNRKLARTAAPSASAN